jgi:hypothetical protein
MTLVQIAFDVATSLRHQGIARAMRECQCAINSLPVGLNLPSNVLSATAQVKNENPKSKMVVS